VTVSVDAGAVMDDVMNPSAAASIEITVAAADMVDSTGPMAMITGMQGSARAFDVTITFSEALGADETLTADEITVTGGTIASVAVDATDAKIYTGMITPNHGVTAVTVQVNAGAVKDASPAMNANLATPTTAHSITVRNTTAPMSAMIASKGYAVFVPMDHDSDALPGGLTPTTVADMPNLVSFFKTGGTIDVAVTGKANHNVIITEIMVAEDLGRVGQTGTMRPEAGQWIELYNNTDAAISVDDISITFETGYPATGAPTDATDRLSNTVAPGWGFEAAFADALSGQTAANASGITTVTKMFKSLRRVHKDNKQLQAAGTVIQNGWAQGSWKLTTDSRVFLAGRVGTPGSENRPTVFTPAVFTAPTMSVTFNEVANRNDDANEWIELKGPKDTNLKLHKISIVTGYDKAANTGTETEIYKFPDADVKIPAGDLLLLTDQDPVNNELAADLEKGVPKPVRYRVVTLKPLPNSGDFLLVLRNKDGKILDVAGHLAGLNDDDPYTLMWPLAANVGAAKPGRISAKNKLAGGNVYKRARAIQGYLANKDNGDEPAFEGAGFSGVGYDRLVNAGNKEHHGTPGYPNGAQIGAGAEATGNVIISEIMVGDGTDRFPQWIEIHNMSDTNGVDLHNWRLYIINHDKNADGSSFAGKILDEVWLRNMKIPPNQTGLIATRSAPRHTTNLPSHRILNLRYDKPLLSSKGFSLRLEANSHEGDLAKRQAGDEVGNLAAADPKNRRADHQAYMEPRWALPAGTDPSGVRISIARRTSSKRKATGTDEAAWISSADDSRPYGTATYYGRSTDIGSPGHTAGGVLPVNLSKFRPERLDSGEIIVRWVTESELNNAGFNILRSEKRDGEFTKLNTKLIAGQGTTSERTTYTYTDTSAKPNVVYYYQIQDVSLDGQVQTLRLSRLKGHISPAGKATTTWGELKALQ
ncbi:lamin tail domain-containing protein, partial [Candidatus Poribacteria bacterium]|nr:lamin tail domain-containing protein [Candidatus Poribacteria bacterium]